MKTVAKLSTLAIFALTLSGCALTGDVLQGAYDNKAEEECRDVYDPVNTPGLNCAAQGDSRWEKYRREDVLKKEDEQ